MDLARLLEYEKASRIICRKYENSMKNYDGSIQEGADYRTFDKYNKIHEKVLTLIEEKLDEFNEEKDA